ncbi:MAG TPA: response regulator, partial [Methylomirabilota bacterium]|nr:response regulator [Methylomirabilota bacterium]
MSGDDAVVFVVDDDKSMRESLRRLLMSLGMTVEVFPSAQAFLDAKRREVPGCLVLDVRLPGLSGLDLQRELAERDSLLPIIFLTAHGDIPMSVRAMKAGAVDFLSKPFRDQDMLDAVTAALHRDAQRRTEAAAKETLRAQYETLTSREREIMGHVTAGLMNKQVAGLIGL